MDRKFSREEGEDSVDLENGRVTTSKEEEGGKDFGLGSKRANVMLNRLRSGHLGCEGVTRGSSGSSGSDGFGSSNNVFSSGNRMVGDIGDKSLLCSGGRKVNREKRSSYKKPPRPPRPPETPLLAVSNTKLSREISERAKLRRARIERVEMLNKKGISKKESSMKINLFAMLTTIIFFAVILKEIICHMS